MKTSILRMAVVFAVFINLNLFATTNPKTLDLVDQLLELVFSEKAAQFTPLVSKYITFDHISKIKNALGDVVISDQNKVEIEKVAIDILVRMNDDNAIYPAILTFGMSDYLDDKFVGISKDLRKKMVDEKAKLLSSMINGEFKSKGMSKKKYLKKNKYLSWKDITKNIYSEIGNIQKLKSTKSLLISKFEKISESKLIDFEELEWLIDGPASFEKRDHLIKEAKSSINILTWAFYDDETGIETAKQLIKKSHEGVDVKIIVDGQIAKKENHFKALDLMEKESRGKIKIIRWLDNRVNFPINGNHRKLFIVDNKFLIAGGMNIGNYYSHRGVSSDLDKWRDTDIYATGNVVIRANNIFNQTWNQQALIYKLHESGYKKVRINNIPKSKNKNIAIINHTPGPESFGGDYNILSSIILAIESAEDSIDIENAYVILTEPLRKALNNALKRGVKVRVLTNSLESIDEPIVMAPILKSVVELKEKGAEVYLKKGSTLHSKFMIIDNQMTIVGSYNLHPRSIRYEGESVVVVFDDKFAQDGTEQFNEDINALNSHELKNKDDIQIPQNFMSTIGLRYFFDQL